MIPTLADQLQTHIYVAKGQVFQMNYEVEGWIDGKTHVFVEQVLISAHQRTGEYLIQAHCRGSDNQTHHICLAKDVYLIPLDTPAKKVLYGKKEK